MVLVLSIQWTLTPAVALSPLWRPLVSCDGVTGEQHSQAVPGTRLTTEDHPCPRQQTCFPSYSENWLKYYYCPLVHCSRVFTMLFYGPQPMKSKTPPFVNLRQPVPDIEAAMQCTILTLQASGSGKGKILSISLIF